MAYLGPCDPLSKFPEPDKPALSTRRQKVSKMAQLSDVLNMITDLAPIPLLKPAVTIVTNMFSICADIQHNK